MNTRFDETAVPPASARVPLQLWGGVECTHNRVGDRFFDQLERTGHESRLDDLDRFHAIGLRTLRLPLLWERFAPHGAAVRDWRWADDRIGRLRRLGMSAVAGLVHHGSGPRGTNLLSDSFSPGLREFARAVARRYPEIDAYTPVNEPLTTARFSALYGHWYPHRRDDRAFVRALLNQIVATRAAMQAIREVNPAARLIQTEDIGRISGATRLQYQVDFENERRWLSLDLLCGRVHRDHPMRSWLRSAGADEAVLSDLEQRPCPPDVVGLNYYLTSDRFLDDDVSHHRGIAPGGNGRHRYVDVEAVRVPGIGLTGHRAHLMAAHQRYGRPLALTEVHAACSREEQVRWLADAWNGADQARREGADVRAVTAWSLLGSFDWHVLVTRETGTYEPGAFDIRSQPPRPTLVAHVLAHIAAHNELPELPCFAARGWWHGVRAGQGGGASPRAATDAGRRRSRQPLLITGRTGTLGAAFARACRGRRLPYRLLSRQALDIADADAVRMALARYQPWAVVNTAGFVDVDRAETERARCFRENTVGPALLADACAYADVRLVTFSSDLVFDGTDVRRPYVESAPCRPLNVYGESKAAAEAEVLVRLQSALVVRTSALFGPSDRFNFVTNALERLASGLAVSAASSVLITPTYVPDLVDTTLDLLLDGECGVWHLASPDVLSWADLARRAADHAGLDARLVQGVPAAAMAWKARRPSYSALGSERGQLLPPLERALERYCQATRPTRAALGMGRAVCV